MLDLPTVAECEFAERKILGCGALDARLVKSLAVVRTLRHAREAIDAYTNGFSSDGRSTSCCIFIGDGAGQNSINDFALLEIVAPEPEQATAMKMLRVVK